MSDSTISYVVRAIGEDDLGQYQLLLEKMREPKARKSRKERWTSSDDWSLGDDFPDHLVRFGGFMGREILKIPMSKKDFETSGIFLGSHVELVLHPVGTLVR